MLKAWLNPQGDFAYLGKEVQAKAGALHRAAETGARFLGLPVENTRDAATWILAAFHSPVCVVPLPPMLPLPALESRLAQLPAGSVIFPGTLAMSKPEKTLLPMRSLNETWAVIFSSGSSGEPKGISLSGTSLRANAIAHAEHSGVGQACWLLDLPLYHIGGLSVLSRAFFLDVGLALGSVKFNAEHSAEWIRSGLVQGLSLVPTTLYRLLQIDPLEFSQLRIVLLGGAAADSALVSRATQRGMPVRITFGMTEHCSQIATEKITGGGMEPLPGVSLRIKADGEVLVRSDCLAGGVFRSGILSPLPLQDGFFPTGDLGELSAGRLTFLGRKSDLIVTGGLNVFPTEVENELQKLEGIVDCAVTSMPDEEWGEVLCAVLVENFDGATDPQILKASLALKLEPRKIPKKWLRLDSIPRSATGKILRAELHQRVLQAYSHS